MAEQTLTTIGRNLRAMREAQGWSRQTLARKAGTSEPTIARIELYGADVKVSTLEAFALALGTTVEALIADLVPEQAAS